MPLPTDDLIIWASSDVNLPNLAGPNKVKPIDDLILKGWDFKQKPAADEFNYILNNLGMHVSYLEENKTYTFSGDVTGTASASGSEDLTIDLQVVDNSHNHVSDNITDATSTNNANKIVKRGASGEVSVGKLTVDKVGDESTISFPATASDIGYIKHSEIADIARMRFSVSDNNISDDKFEFGNTQGLVFTPRFTIAANGATTVDNTVTATNFIGPLQGNAATAASWQTSRAISLTGDVGGKVWLNGASDVVLDTWVADNSHNHTSANISDATPSNVAGTILKRDDNGDVEARNFFGTASYAGTATNNVAVLTGTISHGGNIPLPSGYSEGQCRWMVSMNNDNPSNTAWDWQEGVSSDHIHSYCSANGTRVVTCYRTVLNETGTQTHNGTANYIIIGYK